MSILEGYCACDARDDVGPSQAWPDFSAALRLGQDTMPDECRTLKEIRLWQDLANEPEAGERPARPVLVLLHPHSDGEA